MKKATSTVKKSSAKDASSVSPSKMIDGRIKELGDWRGETLKRIRALIKEADPDVVERTLGALVDFLLDTGQTPGGAPSTIVDVSDSAVRVVRHGAIAWEVIQEWLQGRG